MAARKFGTFGGVFTPSILTILGVIMYMRLGWVVGNAGLVGALLLIAVAHVISVTTGLSISSIATDKKVGAGGVYYVLSRSLGLPMGGAIGVTLWVATALSIALYLVGFAESFNAFVGLDTSINGLRIAGTIALVSLATIAIISTAVAIKTQYFIMAAIAVSLVSIFAGTWEFAPQEVPNFGPTGGLSMMAIFAILFPAVTGFTAGIAMSGDLKDPKKSIPGGTLAAIVVGFVVYTGLAIFMAFAIDPEMLRTDYNVLMKIAFFAPAVVAGIWGATLSSALGGILGGPRILQAMSIDRITPKMFGKGVGKDLEPRNALLITLVIAECGVLIGELDMIAEVCSMFYLAAYGFINLAFFLESWASADFSPSFKVKRWIGLLGFIATFVVMFQLNAAAMVAAFIVIGSIYAYLKRKQLALSSGDVWTSVWSSLVLKGLKKMDQKTDSSRNWIPNILLFSGGTENRPHLIEISKAIAGKVGMISNFDLIENPSAEVLFPKHEQSVKDPILIEHGIFGRRQEVKNVFQGIETIASTYGFSGIEPNTILLGWAKNTADPLMFTEMTQKLIALDYNVLYLDYDWNRKFGKYQRIDIWWHNLKNNTELTLNLVKFISQSPQWNQATLRVILINETNKEGFERRIHKMLDKYRIEATVKVIDNHLLQKSSFDLMKSESHEADLILAGIPEIDEGQEGEFVEKTTEMFESIGTTLLVKTSSMLGEDVQQNTNLDQPEDDTEEEEKPIHLLPLPMLSEEHAQAGFAVFSEAVDLMINDLIKDEIASFLNIHEGFVQDSRKAALNVLSENDKCTVKDLQVLLLSKYQERIQLFLNEDTPYLHERLTLGKEKLNELPVNLTNSLVKNIRIKGKKIALRKTIRGIFENEYLNLTKEIDHELGRTTMSLAQVLKNGLVESVRILAQVQKGEHEKELLVNKSFDELMKEVQELCHKLDVRISNIGRDFIGETAHYLEASKEQKKAKAKPYTKKEKKALLLENESFPDYWQRNQVLFAAKFSTDIKMQKIQLILAQIGDQLSMEIDQSMFTEALLRVEKVNLWLAGLESTGQYSSTELPEVNTSLSYDDILIEGLMFWALVAGEVLPEQLQLMDPESRILFANLQGESVETIDIDSLASYNHLLEGSFQIPVQKHLVKTYQCTMEVLSEIQYNVNQVIQKVTLAKRTLTLEEIKELTSELKSKLNARTSELKTERVHYKEILSDLVFKANGSMNTSALLDHAVRVIPTSGNGSKNGLSKWFGSTSDKASAILGKYGNLLSRSEKNKAVTTQAQANASLDVHFSLKRYMEKLSAAEQVTQGIPFFYKQLFVGKQAAKLDNVHYRELEIEQAKHVLSEIDDSQRTVLIVGEPLSGKSFFAESLAKEIGRDKVIKIQAPTSGSTSVIDLMRSIKKQNTTQLRVKSSIQEAPVGTVFLIDDLELWWSRADTDNKALAAIISMVNDKQVGHRIILTCNSYAHRVMKAQGLLAELTASIVYLKNLPSASLRSLLLERHIGGSLGLRISNGSNETISNKEMRKLLDRYMLSSGGNIGVALNQWISNIVNLEDDILEMRSPKNHPFPELEEKEWLIILSQFILHKHLDAKRIQLLFNYSDTSKAERVIRQLRNDGLLRDILGITYGINPIAQIWVMRKAEQYGLI